MNKPASMLAVSLASTLVACGPAQSPVDSLPADQTSQDVSAEAYLRAHEQVRQDLQALDELELFDVSGMVGVHEMTPGTCYGPCPDDDERMATFVQQAERVHALVELASNPDDSMVCYQRATDIVDESLAAIADLELIEVGAMIVTEPQNNPTCYNLPCQEDIAEADRINEARATHIWQIAEQSPEL